MPEGVGYREAWAAAREVAAERPLIEQLVFVDAVLELRVAGTDELVTLDLRRDTARDDSPRTFAWIAPEYAHRFWLGELHEPTMFLEGKLVVEGELDALLRTLPALPPLSRRYRELVGETTDSPPRFAVLKHYGVRSGLFSGHSVPITLVRDEPAHQSLMATLTLIGLHPICRRIETAAIFEAVTDGRLPRASAAGLLRSLGDLMTYADQRRLSAGVREMTAEAR
jgi:hypothetical protein